MRPRHEIVLRGYDSSFVGPARKLGIATEKLLLDSCIVKVRRQHFDLPLLPGGREMAAK